MLRNDLRFIDILRQANTANTSFYPCDPRGLVAFDEHIVPVSPSGGKWRPMVDLTRGLGSLESAQRVTADDG